MGEIWGEAGRLRLDSSGVLWELLDGQGGGYRRLGPVMSAEVPEELRADLAELVDRWTDAYFPEAEARASYALELPAAEGRKRWPFR